MATIRDVARESGVSVSTVSFVLNDGPRPVAHETRQRVLQVMKRLNYHPSAIARGLTRRHLHTIGILSGMLDKVVFVNPVAAVLLEGVYEAAADAGYNILFFTEQWIDRERSAPMFRDRRTDGVLLLSVLRTMDAVSCLVEMGTPLVVVSADSGVPGVPSVDVDNVQGARLATEHLIGLGHRRIAHLGGNVEHPHVVERRESFLDTMLSAGLSVRPEYLPDGSYHRETAVELAQRLLTLAEPPTAVFAGNDTLAYSVIDVAAALGLRVPQDLSVIGFDDLPASALTNPPLTTIRQPLREIGATAANMLITQIQHAVSSRRDGANGTPEGEGNPVRAMIVRPQLVLRASTAPPGSTGE